MSAPIDDRELEGLTEVVWPVYRLDEPGLTDDAGRTSNAYAVRSREGLVLVDHDGGRFRRRAEQDGTTALAPRVHLHTSWATLLDLQPRDGDRVHHLTILEGLDSRVLARPDLVEDARENPVLHLEHIEPWPMEGVLPGACMYLVTAGNTLLAGDCAVGPQPGEPPMLFPAPGYPSAAAGAGWRRLVHERQIDAVLPRFGEPLLRSQLGDAIFDAALANIWNGDAIDPAQGGIISRVNRAA